MGDHKAAEARKARLAIALRENVRRRKAQARKRDLSPVLAPAPEQPPAPDEAPQGQSAKSPS